MTATCLLLLPHAPGLPAAWLRLFDDGSPRQQGWLDAGQPLPAHLLHDRQVLVVPGAQVLCQTVELQAHTPAQARAEVLDLLAPLLLEPPEQMHLAAVPQAGQTHLVLACSLAQRDAWIVQAAGHCQRPERILPAPLLLPADMPLARHLQHWLWRDDTQACAAEPELIALLSGIDSDTQPPALLDVARLPGDGVDLARKTTTSTQRKRTAPLLLAISALLLAAPLVQLTAGGWWQWQSLKTLAASEQLAQRLLGPSMSQGPALLQLRQQLTQADQRQQSWDLIARTLTALPPPPGTRITAISLQQGQLTLELADSDANARLALEQQLAGQGLASQTTDNPQQLRILPRVSP